MTDELEWQPPGDGVWWLTREHFPRPVSRLFDAVFPSVTTGWNRGAARYGLPMSEARWGCVNGWYYYSAGAAVPADLPHLERAAIHTLETRAWRDEVERWYTAERPAVERTNRALQAVAPEALSDNDLGRHFAATVEQFATAAPLHFEHLGFDIVFGLLLDVTASGDVPPADVVALLAGASPATTAGLRDLDPVVDALRIADAPSPATLEDVRAASPDAARALDSYLERYAWQLVGGHEVGDATVGERPLVLAATIRTQLIGNDRTPHPPDVDGVRARIPFTARVRFDELLADARASYALRDDDNALCFTWPLGLMRRAAMEIGRRAQLTGRLGAVGDVFEGDPTEIAALLGGNAPPRETFTARADRLARSAAAHPPLELGAPLPHPELASLPEAVASLASAQSACWNATPPVADVPLRGTAIGSGVARGRARVVDDVADVLLELEPGEVLVATTTMTTHNALFPIIAAVATAEGGVFSHTAILAREFGIPAVVGVADLLEAIATGDLVEVDADRGLVRVVAEP